MVDVSLLVVVKHFSFNTEDSARFLLPASPPSALLLLLPLSSEDDDFKTSHDEDLM
jgi:hypothetical protein